MRRVCREACAAVNANTARLRMPDLEELTSFDDLLGLEFSWSQHGWSPNDWHDPPFPCLSVFVRVRLPGLRHLKLISARSGAPLPPWPYHIDDRGDAARMGSFAALVEAYGPQLRTLHLPLLRFPLPFFIYESDRQFVEEEDPFEGVHALLERAFAAPMPALERLALHIIGCAHDSRSDEDAACLEALRPLQTLSLPRLRRLDVVIFNMCSEAGEKGVLRLLAEADLPALRHLGLAGYQYSHRLRIDCFGAVTTPRWAPLQSMSLDGRSSGAVAAAFAAQFAPTLRHLSVFDWPPVRDAEWPELRSLDMWCPFDYAASGEGVPRLEGVRLPRLARLALTPHSLERMEDLADCRPTMPSLRVLELHRCFCGDRDCRVEGCGDADTAECLEVLRGAWPGLEVRRKTHDWVLPV